MTDPHTAIFDIAILQEQYQGMPDKMKVEALQLFLAQGAQYCSCMCNFASQPQDEVFRCYHSLKTMSAMVGATRLRALCINFEQATEDAERQIISEQLKICWQQTDEAIHLALQAFAAT